MWTIQDAGRNPITCGIGLTAEQIPSFCTVIGQGVYDSASKPVTIIGKYVGLDGLSGLSLIVALTDESASAAWGCGSLITVNANSISNGAANTNNIISALCGLYPDRAAVLCSEKGGGGWFLPTVNQLQLVYSKKNLIEGLSASHYWSSEEYSGNLDFAKTVVFTDGAISQNWQHGGTYVRCVRTF